MGPHHLRFIFKTRLPMRVYFGLQVIREGLRKMRQFSLSKKLPETESVRWKSVNKVV